ncbi:MAG TPA: ATP-binding protein [Verrucomicrobiae bacterium]|nr:ATP-binding protein [Verrucomicrobiae bacterium]
MKTILVLAPTPVLPDAIRPLLSPEDYRLLHRTDIGDIEPLAKGSFLDACIVDAEGGDVRALWMIEKLRQLAPHTPILVFKGAAWEWEEEAYLKGVSAVLSKPVRGRLLMSMLDRFGKPAAIQPPAPRPIPARAALAPVVRPTYELAGSSQPALQVLRRFSEVLTHSLNSEGMLRQFLMFLREILGINRSSIFLRYSAGTFGVANPDSRQFRPAASIGLVPVKLNDFELSLDSGIAGFLNSTGRLLRRDSDEANDPEIQKEFQLLGAQLAIPILDRQSIVGIAVFDERLTGEPLLNQEIELIFHLLEELGLALKNIWLHDQVVTNHQIMTDVLRELTSACVVVDRDLKILHANKAARSLFSRPGRRGGDIEFIDFPAALGSKVYQVLNTGTGIAPFKFHTPEEPQSIFNVSISPFQLQDGLPRSVLLIVEDRSREEQLRRLEVETANLRLVKTMADRLAHEIGNALVPLSTYQQLLADKYKDPDFRAGLETAMADSVKRISRLTSQMRFLARDTMVSREALPLAQLLEDAFHEAQKYQPLKSANLKMEKREQPIILAGDRAALKHAVAEVMLNALQANPSNAKVEVRTHLDSGERGSHWVHIDILDNGPGFSAEALKKVPEPFFTTRNVGLGLGLAVTRKIIETHHGKLEVIEGRKDHPGTVRISLPLDASAA